jgi:dipeptidyl-peptidase-4
LLLITTQAIPLTASPARAGSQAPARAAAPLNHQPAGTQDLTIERIFADPDLSGPQLRQPSFSPDGRYVAYLQGSDSSKDRLDLWAFDTRSAQTRLLVDARALIGEDERLSAEEEARRERQRTASLRGIVEYQFSPDGKHLLIPLGGDLYLYDLSAASDPVTRLTTTPAYETDARFSPGGRYVSFIRDQDVFAIDLRQREEIALTHGGGGPVSHGMAEFVAQEEMDRNTGYWWSPDDSHLAYTRTDDTPVQEVERFEINADGARMYRQRYPAAGTANTRVELKVLELATSSVTDVELRIEDGYLARVDWFPDSRHLAVQRQTRDQKRLDLLKVDIRNGSSRIILTETAEHWIELHHDLRFLDRRRAFIWASRRSGYRHLYLYDLDGKLIRPLTAGDWMVVGDGIESGLIGVDETRGRIYFLANEASPLQRHVYSASLDTRDPATVRRVSRETGWHDAKLLPGARYYLDQWSSPQHPPSVALRNPDGSLHRWLARNALDESHPYHPYLAGHATEEFGSIAAGDGQLLHYRLLKPAPIEAGKRYPVVIDVYGGPHFQYVRQDWMGGGRAAQGYFRQVLARNGFVVFTLDNRGSGFRGNAFETAIAGRLGKVEIEDQLRGVDFLKTLPFVDAERIGIMGWSYGGYMSLMALGATDAFKAGVAGAPVTDWRLYDTHYTERYLGTPAANAEGYRLSAVLPHAATLDAGLLLVHGMADDNVLFTHSTMLMRRLQELDRPFDLMTYPGSKHGLIRMPDTGRHYYQMVLRFFQRELQ